MVSETVLGNSFVLNLSLLLPPVLGGLLLSVLLLTSLSVLRRKKLAICSCDLLWKPRCKETTKWNPFSAGGLFPSAPHLVWDA